ncbi:unnamed protein product [Symbiodinium sp. CCMP2456]|nr:unnamed protein product [Symbiodinium sp. CCMP2456]
MFWKIRAFFQAKMERGSRDWNSVAIRAQELDRAFMFLRDMQEQRIAQNIMTWAPVIEAVCKYGDDAAVQDGLQRMLRAGVAPQGRAQQQLEEPLSDRAVRAESAVVFNEGAGTEA